MEKRSLYGKHPQKIQDFLVDCTAPQPEPASDETEMTQLLCDYLAETCPQPTTEVDAKSTIVDRFHLIITRQTDQPTGEILGDPQAEADTVHQIKECFKQREQQVSTEPQRRAATVVYFAAIAHALVHRGEMITEYSEDQLTGFFDALLSQSWIVPELKDLLAKARQKLAHGQ